MIIIGIDPGTRITGYGVIIHKPHKTEAIDFGCIRTSSAATISARYKIIFEAIEKLLELHNPDVLVVEGQYVHKNALSAMKLGMARAMALLAAERRGVLIAEYAPTKVKKSVVGRGSASKHQVQKMVQMLLGLEELPTPDDAADALALAICHTHLIKCAYV